MSGYLQRLARSITQPAESVHPMLGSIFAPANYGRAGDPVMHDVTVTAREAAAPAVEQQDREPSSPQLLPLQTVVSTQLVATSPETPRQDERRALQPLLSAVSTQHSVAADKRDADAPAAPIPDAKPSELKHTLLMPQSAKRQPDVSIAKSSISASATRRAAEKVAQRVEPEQNDVQIHIGCIALPTEHRCAKKTSPEVIAIRARRLQDNDFSAL